MSSMIKQHLSEDEISNSLTYQWLEDSNKRTIKNLGETPDKTQKELTAFIKEKNIKTTNPENLAQLIITLWIRYKQAIDMVKYPEYKKERKKLESVIEKAKQLIGQINRMRQTCIIPCMLDLDLNISFDYEGLIKANQEYIEYLELVLQQYFGRGTSHISTDKLQELAMHTMFYIGEELLNLKKLGKPSPLFSFIKILLQIHEGSNKAVLGEDKISTYHKSYCEELEKSLEKPTVTGNKLNTNYSITAYQDGWLCQAQNGDEKQTYFFLGETSKGAARILNFIYKKQIPDHAITRGIFDMEIISEIINLTT